MVGVVNIHTYARTVGLKGFFWVLEILHWNLEEERVIISLEFSREKAHWVSKKARSAMGLLFLFPFRGVGRTK